VCWLGARQGRGCVCVCVWGGGARAVCVSCLLCGLGCAVLLQAGVAVSKWAIEYEQPAADAFKLNNPEAAVFCNNCNAILVVSGGTTDAGCSVAKPSTWLCDCVLDVRLQEE